MTDHTTRAEELRAMKSAATEGPWTLETVRTQCGICHKIGPFPAPDYDTRRGPGWACVYDDYPSGSRSDTLLANARLIVAAPDLAAECADAIDALAAAQAENARLRAALRNMLMIYDGIPMTGIYAGQLADKARAALDATP